MLMGLTLTGERANSASAAAAGSHLPEGSVHVSIWGRDGWIVEPGSGRHVEIGGPHRLELLLRGTDVGGAMGAFIFNHAPIEVNPPHAHLEYMKIIYVMDGTYEVRVGDAQMTAGPGGLVIVPKGSQHTFTTRTGGRMLFVCSPAGNEELFLELEKLGGDPTGEQLAELHERMRTIGLPGEDLTNLSGAQDELLNIRDWGPVDYSGVRYWFAQADNALVCQR
jgi:mannose-6-phosphate isomerase-like protein (cupin superfamily)